MDQQSESYFRNKSSRKLQCHTNVEVIEFLDNVQELRRPKAHIEVLIVYVINEIDWVKILDNASCCYILPMHFMFGDITSIFRTRNKLSNMTFINNIQ